MLDAGVPDGAYPRHDQIMIAVECECTRYKKEYLRSILGVRRELSRYDDSISSPRTDFRQWPAKRVPANPTSCVLAYGSDPATTAYPGPGEVFGIRFLHEPLP